MHQPDHRVLLLAAGLALTGAPLAAQQGTWALTNARIETVTRGVIDRGTIVIRDGLITAVGASVAVPADARTIDLAGRTVSPGLIDLASPFGLASAPAGGPGATAPRFTGIDPERRVADELQLSASDAKSARDAGITAILVAPSRGLFRGQSALVPTRDSASGRDALRAVVGQHLGYDGIGQGEYPGSLLGVIAAQRQLLYDARRHGLIEDRWNANPRGVTRPEADPGLEALVPVVRGAQPLFADARNENQIRRAAALADEFKLKLVVLGATEGWRAVDVLATRGVAVSVNYPRPSEVTGWRYRGGIRHAADDSAAADAAARAAIEGNAAALHRAGIRLALTSGGQSGSFLANARKAVAAGLPAAVALEAMTLRPAELAGVGEAVGSVEAGKVANLVVSTGPLLADTSRITMVFVDGARHEVAAPARTAAAGAAANGGGAAVSGTWSITTNSPQGAMESTLTVTQQGSAFTGTMTSQMLGTSPVADGAVSGRRVTWNLNMSMGGQSFTLTYEGEVTGNRMSGTVSAGSFGSFPFTGEKRP